MAWADAISAIKDRFTANWIATSICYQNGEASDGTLFAPPTDGVSAWVYLEVLGAGGQRAAVGKPTNRLYRDRGAIMATVFVPVNTGTAALDAHLDSIGNIFRDQSFSAVRCFEPDPAGEGAGDDAGNWYRKSVSIPFQCEYFA